MRMDLPPRWIFVKAGLFVVLALLTGGFLLWQQPTYTTAACLCALVWAACRAYFFLFHVVQHWLDPTFRYTGLVDALRHLRRRDPPHSAR